MKTTLETIQQMHTTHGNFSKREITDGDLQTILAASVRAATASNRQSYSIIVFSDRQKMRDVCGYSGSRALLFCVDTNRLNAQAAHLGYDRMEHGTVAFVTGSIDTILAAQTAILCAQSLGIDTLPTNGIHRGDIRRVYRLLHLPEKYCFPLLMVVMGYADRETPPLKGRLDGVGVIHREEYHAVTATDLDQIVETTDDAQRHFGFTDKWREQGYAHYLDWFYQVWMKDFKGPEPGIPTIMETLISCGFWE
jgi:nitroreductase